MLDFNFLYYSSIIIINLLVNTGRKDVKKANERMREFLAKKNDYLGNTNLIKN